MLAYSVQDVAEALGVEDEEVADLYDLGDLSYMVIDDERVTTAEAILDYMRRRHTLERLRGVFGIEK